MVNVAATGLAGGAARPDENRVGRDEASASHPVPRGWAACEQESSEREPSVRASCAGATVEDAEPDWLDTATSDIEIVDHLEFDPVDELPFPVEPAAATAIEDDAAAIEDDATAEHAYAADAFVTLAAAMVNVMLERGAGPDAAHFLRALLGLERMDDRSPGEANAAALIAAKLAVASPRGLNRTSEFGAQLLAWRRVLSGESQDFGACGTMALDEWAAAVVASTLGDTSQASGIRRELRRHGVAAFGLVSQATAA